MNELNEWTEKIIKEIKGKTFIFSCAAEPPFSKSFHYSISHLQWHTQKLDKMCSEHFHTIFHIQIRTLLSLSRLWKPNMFSERQRHRPNINWYTNDSISPIVLSFGWHIQFFCRQRFLFFIYLKYLRRSRLTVTEKNVQSEIDKQTKYIFSSKSQ